MNTRTIIGTLAAVLVISAQAHAASSTPPVTHTPKYDRPGPEQIQPDGHQKLVHWTDFEDNLTATAQSLADAYGVADFDMKKNRHDKPKE